MRGWGYGRKKASNKFSAEVRERAVRMVREHRGEHASQWAATASIAGKIGCTAQTLRNWVRQSERDAASAPARRRTSAIGSRPWSGRSASCARPTRFYARRRLILPRRSSTAGSSHDRLHRRSSRRLWGRADLQGLADRPVELSRACGGAPIRAGCRRGRNATPALREDPARLRRELLGLWRAQGVAAVAAGG